MEIYKFTGTKLITFNSSIASETVDNTTPDTLPVLARSSKFFEIKNIGVYTDIKYMLESPLSFAKSTDTELEKWDRDRELIKNFQNIRIEFSINNAILFTTFVTGSQVPYDFYLNKSVHLNELQSLNVSLKNTGHGLLTGTDKIMLHFPYELTLMGEN